MKKKTLNKDIRNSLRQSKGRFLSIMLLMMLGAFSLVGLKVSGPDIEDTLNSYMETANAADLFVVAGYGFKRRGPSRDSRRERRSGVWLFCRYGD